VSGIVLWHIAMSHYSEKARWAFDHKGVGHRRRQAPSGAHLGVAFAKTRGRQITFPVAEFGGETIGGSAAIIAELEARYPEPPLYPSSPAERARALEIERYFDTEVAPAVRLLGWSGITQDPELLEEIGAENNPMIAWAPRASGALTDVFVRLRYGAGANADADAAMVKASAGLDRVEAELGNGDYLVGDRFSVADLAAAALLYPLVLPPEAPRIISRVPRDVQPFVDSIADRPGYRWVQETYRRHRAPTA
jgi:glutathione S-transferase